MEWWAGARGSLRPAILFLAAALARALSATLHPAREGEAFTTALLLDLAIPVLVNRLGDDYDGDAALLPH